MGKNSRDSFGARMLVAWRILEGRTMKLLSVKTVTVTERAAEMRGTDKPPPLNYLIDMATRQRIQCQFFEALGQPLVSSVSTHATFAGE
jgi:hypothetical protein